MRKRNFIYGAGRVLAFIGLAVVVDACHVKAKKIASDNKRKISRKNAEVIEIILLKYREELPSELWESLPRRSPYGPLHYVNEIEFALGKLSHEELQRSFDSIMHLLIQKCEGEPSKDLVSFRKVAKGLNLTVKSINF